MGNPRKNLNEYNFLKHNLSIEPTHKQIKAFVEIKKTNQTDYDETYILFQKYWNSTSNKERTRIKSGETGLEEYNKTMKARKRPEKIVSSFRTSYWMSKGFTEEQAKTEVSKLQSTNAKKHIYKKHQHPIHEEYYIARGLTEEEAYLAKEKFMDDHYNMRNLHKLSEEEYEKFLERYPKRKATLLDRYGTTCTNCKISKESLRFFLPIYKFLRRNGIEKTDINWGISGSKEFTTSYSGRNFSYDFTVRSKKIFIEYNGIFWHPKDTDLNWTNPWTTREEAKETERLKLEAATNLGYRIITVWSDENLKIKQKEIFDDFKFD